jgi:hypothetical protein
MQSTETVHMWLVWKRKSPTPKILFHARFPEYIPNDMADPALVDLAIMLLPVVGTHVLRRPKSKPGKTRYQRKNSDKFEPSVHNPSC